MLPHHLITALSSFNPSVQRRALTKRGEKRTNRGQRAAGTTMPWEQGEDSISYFSVMHVALSSDHCPFFLPSIPPHSVNKERRAAGGSWRRELQCRECQGNKVGMLFCTRLFCVTHVAASSNHFPSPFFNPSSRRRATKRGWRRRNCGRRAAALQTSRENKVRILFFIGCYLCLICCHVI